MKNLRNSATVPSSTGRQVGMVCIWRPDHRTGQFRQQNNLAEQFSCSDQQCEVTEVITVDGYLLIPSAFPISKPQSHSIETTLAYEEHLLINT